MSRFVQPDTRTLTISEGDTLIIRARLNNGEERAMFTRIRGRQPSERDTGLAIVLAYLLDWSIRDDEGRPVRIAEMASAELERILDGMTPEAYQEIEDAIILHDQAQREERAKKKMILSGAPA